MGVNDFKQGGFNKIKITHKSSMREYERLRKDQRLAPEMPIKPLRVSPYSVDGRGIVAIVRSDNRKDGIMEGIRLLGGLKPFLKGVEGEIVIKPNCNTDDPFPRNTHAETVKIIAKSLIEADFPADRIVVGDISGRWRGLPTRNTMMNMGLLNVIDELGINASYFEEEDWVTVKHHLARTWLEGIRIPKRIYQAGRIIFTPIIRPHEDAIFSLSMKLAVGLMDVVARDWLHNGESLYEKLAEFNLAVSTDLSIVDGMKCYIDQGPEFKNMVEPKIMIVGNDRVAVDAVTVAIMKQLGAYGVEIKPVREHEQIILAERLGLGKSSIDDIVLRTSDLTDSQDFESIVTRIKKEL
tara:strand:+ start:53 stop:1108 length:1056 start_codon:yes stop_codon:yes gene_type:complete